MPGLQVIKTLGAMKFYSHGLMLPEKWRAPGGEFMKQYNDAIPAAERVAVPRVVPPWFRPAEPTKPFQDVCDTIGKDFKDFHDRMCDAVVFAHNLWKLQASFSNVMISGPVGTGPPGCLKGPPLQSLIRSAPSCIGMIKMWAKYRDAVAAGVSRCFQMWQSSVTVPGLPWWPPYASMPSGPAPPLPNIPMPLISCVSSAMSQITTAPPLAQAMRQGLTHRVNEAQIRALFDAIATTLSMAFMTWLPSQQVMNVLGSGASTASPPLVPVGIIVGVNISTPGHLAT